MRTRGQQRLLQERVDLDVGLGDGMPRGLVPALVLAAEIFPGDRASLSHASTTAGLDLPCRQAPATVIPSMRSVGASVP